jgi:hypothetical protein
VNTRVLLLSAFFAATAIAACSSNDAESFDSRPFGTVALGGECTASSECESPLTCLFPLADKCGAKGRCATSTACNTTTLCPCGGGAAVVACVDDLYAPMPVTGDTSCVSSDEDSGSHPDPPPTTDTDSGSQPPPTTDQDSGSTETDSGSTNETDSGADTGSTTEPDSGSNNPPDSGGTTPDAGHDAGHDSGSGSDAGCPFVAPGTPASCNACTTKNGKTCDVNGCYGGYYCNTSTNKCVAKPTC